MTDQSSEGLLLEITRCIELHSPQAGSRFGGRRAQHRYTQCEFPAQATALCLKVLEGLTELQFLRCEVAAEGQFREQARLLQRGEISAQPLRRVMAEEFRDAVVRG